MIFFFYFNSSYFLCLLFNTIKTYSFFIKFVYYRAKEEAKKVQEMEDMAIQSQIESHERQVAAEKEVLHYYVNMYKHN